MKNYFFNCLLLITLSNLLILAQDLDKPRTFDEIPLYSNLEEQEARSDNFANELMQNPAAIGYIEVFTDENKLKGFPIRYAARFKTFLTKIKKIAPDRIITKVCSDNQERIKFTLVPLGVNYESCSRNSSLNLSKTFLFDSYYYMSDDFGGCCIIGELHKEEAEASLTAISEIVKQSPENKIYLTAYICMKCQDPSGKFKADSIKLTNKILKEAKDIFFKNGIEDSRIVTAKRKAKSFRGVDIWFVPKGGEIPKPKPDYFPKKRRSKK